MSKKTSNPPPPHNAVRPDPPPCPPTPGSAKRFEINLNDEVWVKLTEEGHDIHYEQHRELRRSMKMPLPYNAPKEDAEGWSKWQLWHLMEVFGPHIRLGSKPPIHTVIRLSPNAKLSGATTEAEK